MIQRSIASAALMSLLALSCFSQDGPAAISQFECTQAPGTLKPIPPGPVGDIDQVFLDAYTSRCTATLATAQPYIVVSGSSLILRRVGKPEESIRVIPDSYHALKDIAHVPFTIYLLLSPLGASSDQMSNEQLKPLQALSAKIDAANNALNTGNYSEEELSRQKKILDNSAIILTSTIQARKVSPDELARFAKSVGPLMLQNAWDAGCQQIRATHAQMMAWKKEFSQQEWEHLIVVNRARHQARYRNAATLYFHWLFADHGSSWSYPGESLRVIYAESLGPKQEAKDEFATVLIDADASAAFFGDPWRLTEDILSNGAADCIAKLPADDRVYK